MENGTVEPLLISKDKEVRAASVRTHAKDKKPIILRRPIQKLYPLEVKESEEETRPTSLNELSSSLEVHHQKNATPEFATSETRIRPKRIAVEKARKRIRSWAEDLNNDTLNYILMLVVYSNFACHIF